MGTRRIGLPRSLAIVALVGATLALGAAPAHAVVAAAGPGAAFAGYATRVVVAPQGGPVTFANADLSDHTLTAADAVLPRRIAKKTRYCKSYGVKSCPLFTSGVVQSGESAEVAGLKRAKAGREYEFQCEIHSGMRGTLVVAGGASDR